MLGQWIIARSATLVATAACSFAAASYGWAGPTSSDDAAVPRIDLKGSRIIACCCAAPCPCRINKPPMHCHGCDATTVVRIDKGYLGKTRMDGVLFAVIGRSFSENPRKNWNYVYVADTATKEQVAALQAMFEANGKALGSKGPYIAGSPVGMRQVPMTYTISADGREHNAVISGILQLETRSIVLPGRKQPVLSSGIFDAFGDGFVHADCLAHRYQDTQINYAWDLTGRQANQADFELTNERLAQGGIGWGCWSAHADLGSKDRYQEQLVGHDDGEPATGEGTKDCCAK